MTVLLLAVLSLSACERQMHDMYEQPRYDAYEGSSLWPDGRASQPPVDGTVAASAGTLAGTSSGRKGSEVPQQWHEAAAAQVAPISKALLLRGQERYTIYCSPCHSELGDGDGPVARRGFPHPPTYHQARLRDATDRYLFDVISNGHGVMYGYADRVPAPDRWAIVAYIRALQLSQDAKLADLPRNMQEKVQR